MQIEKRIDELGYKLPQAPVSGGMFVPCKQVGKLIFVAGTGSVLNGRQEYRGKVGADLTEEEGVMASRNCALNILAHLKNFLGDLDKIDEIISIKGFIASSDDFHRQSAVLDGASELLTSVFGQKGRHVRAAIGTNVLPKNNPVEIEAIVTVK